MKVGDVDMDKYQFGEFVYQRRKQLHMTQDELGRKLGVTNKAVSKWETGETLPDIQLLESLASTLDVTIDELLTQVKPEVKVELIKDKRPILISVILGIISILLVISLVIVILFKDDSSEVVVAEDDYTDYFNIIPCVRSEVNGTTLTIYTSVEKISDEDFTFTAVFTIKYYYANLEDGISFITYTDREFSFDGSQFDKVFTLKPISNIDDFKEYLGFEINYEVVSFEK